MYGKKKNARRGFTLVEVIVVLVILAILAAIMIPAMTGWIDKAKEKRLVVACRTCVTAAQTLVTETYGASGAAAVPEESAVKTLAGVPGSVSGISLSETAVATLTYTDDASSDYVTYILTPGPQYVFGTGLTAYVAWESGTTYQQNDIVVADGIVYKYRSSEAGKSATSKPEDKKEIWNVVGMADGSIPQYSWKYHYAKGTIVESKGVQYRCIIDNGSGTPSDTSRSWERVE